MIIATAGHVDHGKTALLEALTGTNTSHLPEEKKRGMTIDLGYAYLPVSKESKSNRTLGFIDVPGHERFLANMLAGLGGIDYAMLIVAADEGVQTQTKEHLSILTLLAFRQIILVITKADRTTEDQIATLISQMKQDYPVLKNSPHFVTSAKTGQGITALRHHLSTLPNLAETDKPFRYAIDRIFHLKGVGKVVTGTAFSGSVNIDDELLLSNGQPVRIKNIHSQNQANSQGSAGQRLALNIHADLNRTIIERGDWLLSKCPQAPTERITVQLNNIAPLKENQPVHIYHAASRCIGRLNLLQQKTLTANQQSLAEVILDSPLFLAYGDRLILRSGDAKQLIAGAQVLEIDSPSRYKRSEARLAYLAQLQQAKTPAQRTALYLQNRAMLADQLAWAEQLTEPQLQALLQENQHIQFQQWCFNRDYQQQQISKLVTALDQYHQQYNDQIGISKARLYRMACLNQPQALIYHFIDELLDKEQLHQTRGWLHLPSHKIQFNEKEQKRWQLILTEFEQQRGKPLWVRDLAHQFAVDEKEMRNFLYKAGKLGLLTPIVRDRFFLTQDIYQYAHRIKNYLSQQETISVNQLRDELAFGRKLTVQLIEYFDRTGFLLRKGDVHILRDKDLFG